MSYATSYVLLAWNILTEQILSKSLIPVSLLGLCGECPFLCQVWSELLAWMIFGTSSFPAFQFYQVLWSWGPVLALLGFFPFRILFEFHLDQQFNVSLCALSILLLWLIHQPPLWKSWESIFTFQRTVTKVYHDSDPQNQDRSSSNLANNYTDCFFQ